MRLVTLLCAAFLCLQCAQAAKILVIFALPSKSHYILGSSLSRLLAEAGHDVTMMSPFGEKDPPKGTKYRDIKLDAVMKVLEKKKNENNMYEIGDMGAFVNIPFIAYMMLPVGEVVLSDPTVQKFINSGEKFDAVIIEQFYSEALKSLASHFGAIQIVFSSLGPNYWVNPLVGNPSPIAYVPDTFLSYSSEMTFCERLTNTAVYLLNVVTHHLYSFPKSEKLIQTYIPNPPHINDVIYNVSLVLLNSHPSLNQPVPQVPNMVNIGGYHVKPPKKLPKDLQEFMDNAKEGVVYFSMGSNLRSADLPVAKRDAIIKAFSKLKQKVLWKWEEDSLPGQTSNIKLGKWLPQPDILAHPNLKLFITHGGLLSTTEAIYSGVPVLAIPIFGDQSMNAKRAVLNGYGLSLPYKSLTEEALTEKLDELLNNPKYRNSAKEKSIIFHDRLVKPADEAAYWVDYAIRHKGAPHLRVAGVDLPWYQYFLLDVIAFIAGVVVIGLCIAKFILKALCRKICSKSKAKKVKKN